MVTEVLRHLPHLHLQEFRLKFLEERDAHFEHGAPPFAKEHVDDGNDHPERKEAGEQGHEPLRCEVVWCRLEGTQVAEETGQVELD